MSFLNISEGKLVDISLYIFIEDILKEIPLYFTIYFLIEIFSKCRGISFYNYGGKSLYILYVNKEAFNIEGNTSRIKREIIPYF